MDALIFSFIKQWAFKHPEINALSIFTSSPVAASVKFQTIMGTHIRHLRKNWRVPPVCCQNFQLAESFKLIWLVLALLVR